MPHVIKARSIGDLISATPALLGFHPTSSLVALCLRSDRRRVTFTLRVDLPDPRDASAMAAELIGYLVRQEPDHVIVIAFADAADERAAPAALAMAAELAEHGIDRHDVVRYDGARYVSLTCTADRCCPPGGVAWDLDSSQVLAEAVFEGHEILPDRDALSARFQPVTGARAAEVAAACAAESAVVRQTEREAVGAGTSRESAARRARAHAGRPRRDLPGGSVAVALARSGLARVRPLLEREVPGESERAGEGAVLAPSEIAALAVWTTATVHVRDVAWAMLVRPTARESLALWREVAVTVPTELAAAPLALAAFAAWLSGDGAQAQCALDRLATVAPRYRMGQLLEHALVGCIDPSTWVGPSVPDVLRGLPGVS